MHNSVSAPRIELRLARGCLGGTYGQESSQESRFEIQDEARQTTDDGEIPVKGRVEGEAQGRGKSEAAEGRAQAETGIRASGRHHREDGKRHSRRGGRHQGNRGHAREDASSGDA
jgi:hypothetical protein